jgi:hypothetical protein
MKNKLLLSLATLLFMASCSTKIELVKRKYGKGYYVAVTKKAPAVKPNDSKVALAKKQVETPSVPVATIPAPNEVPTLSEPQKVQNTFQQEVKTEAKETSGKVTELNQNLVKTGNKEVLEKGFSFKTIKAIKAAKSVLKSGKAAADDTNTILLVILCILWWLNLVAVYLHDGRKFTKNFWITLVLDFTVIGGIVFSILVILDIINFA